MIDENEPVILKSELGNAGRIIRSLVNENSVILGVFFHLSRLSQYRRELLTGQPKLNRPGFKQPPEIKLTIFRHLSRILWKITKNKGVFT